MEISLPTARSGAPRRKSKVPAKRSAQKQPEGSTTTKNADRSKLSSPVSVAKLQGFFDGQTSSKKDVPKKQAVAKLVKRKDGNRRSSTGESGVNTRVRVARRGSTGSVLVSAQRQTTVQQNQDLLRRSAHESSLPSWTTSRVMRSPSMNVAGTTGLDTRSEHRAPGKARTFMLQRKFEHIRKGERVAPEIDEAVRRRRTNHLEKCGRAATHMQRLIRGWLVRVRLFGREHAGYSPEVSRKLQRQMKLRKVVKKQPNGGPVRAGTSGANGRRKQVQVKGRANPLNGVAAPKPVSTAARIKKKQSKVFGIMYEQRIKDLESEICWSKDSNDLEQQLCSVFKSNFAKKAANVRRASLAF